MRAFPLKEMQSNRWAKVWLNSKMLNYLPIIYFLPPLFFLIVGVKQIILH